MKDIRLTFSKKEEVERIERWVKALNLPSTTATKKALFDAIDKWEKENNIDNG